MFQRPFSVLAVDNEYLVAMEIELILADALDCDVTITTSRGFNDAVDNRVFDLAILDGDDQSSGPSWSTGLLNRNIGCFFLSTFDANYVPLLPGLNIQAILMKPFSHEQLVGATTAVRSIRYPGAIAMTDRHHLENACAVSTAECGSGP